MKVCMVNPLFLPYRGGTEKHIYEVARRLAESHEVTVLTARLPNTPKTEVIDGINVVRTRAVIVRKSVHPLPPPFPIAPHMFLKIRAQAENHDIIHFHNRFNYSLVDFGMVKRKNKKLCMTLHNSRPEGIDFITDLVGKGYDDLIGEQMMKQCDRIAAVSRATLKETVPPELWEKSTTIYNGVNLKNYDPSIDAGPMKEKFGEFFFCNARLVKQKGLRYLIRAMKKVDSRLVLLGRGPLEKELKEKAGENVTFITDKVSEQDLSRLYKACNAFILPSLYEPFGMVLVEAMAMEKPVIASRVGGIPEIVTEDTGLLVEPRNPGQLAEKMNHLLENPEEGREKGEKGRERVEEKFTWDHTAEGYEKFYQSLEE